MNLHLHIRISNVVMQSQKALVDVVGKFTPKIVKMDGAKHQELGKEGARRGSRENKTAANIFAHHATRPLICIKQMVGRFKRGAAYTNNI